MFNYRDSLQILIDINLVIIISISIISWYIYFTKKDLKLKMINYTYLTDFLIYSILLDTNYKKEFIQILTIYIALKFMYYFIIREKININNKNIKIISIITLIQIIVLYINKQCFFSMNIIANIFILRNNISKSLNKSYIDFNKNIKKFNVNNNSNEKILNKINKEKLLQEENKNKISELNSKINKAMKEVEMGIFILSCNNQIKDYNKAFYQEINCNIKTLDVLGYIQQRFLNSIDCIEIINKISENNCESIDLYTLDEKVYKFTCIKDKYSNEKICILNDITQTTIIQKKLRESEEKYRKLMDILSDGVVIHDMNNINYINESAVKLFKLEKNDNLNLNIKDIKDRIDNNRNEFLKNMSLVFENKSEEIINKIKTIDGTILEVITTKITINNNNKLLTIFVDVTTMEKALIELEDSTQSYKMLMENIPEGIVIIDKNTKNYIYQNRAMIKILKLSGIDNINKIINDYIKNNRYENTQKYNLKNGDISSVVLTIIDTNDENQLLGIIRCIDQEEKIKLALKKLDSINIQYEVKNEFLTTISQNLKNPINTITTVNNLLESNKSKYNSKYINNYTDLIKRNCYRLKRLINNMNEIVEIENGFYLMDYKNCDIVNLIKNIIYMVNKYLEDKGIEIEFESSINKRIIAVDIDKIERIILNLLSNAIKFSEKGSSIIVRIEEDNKYINISVADKGCGIPSDKLNFIFTKFAQVDKTLTRSAEGSGVGLSLVKRFIDLHKGKIKVESEEGIGSKFTVSLKNDRKLIENKGINKLQLNKEKMHIEFADIYF